MKYFRVALTGIIIVGVFLCWIGLSGDESESLWPNKQGELCWTLYPPAGNTLTAKVAIVRTYGDHYIFHGTTTEQIGDEVYVSLVNGNAEIVGNKVIMQGSSSGISGTDLYGSLGIIELYLSDLSGTSVGVWVYAPISGDPGVVKSEGPVVWELTVCN